MDELATSFLKGLKKEFTESNARLKEACDNALRDLENKAPQLMASQVNELKSLNIEIILGNDSNESPSWKEYYCQMENRFREQLSSALEKHLNQPITENELIEFVKINREDKNNHLNGIAFGPKQVIDEIKQDSDNWTIKTVIEMRDTFIQGVREQTARTGQPILPEIRITLVFPTSSTLNVLMYHAEADVVKVDCIVHLPSITLDTNEVLRMHRGEILDPLKLREKCPMDLAVTHRIRDDLSLNPSEEQFLEDGYIRRIPSIMRNSYDSKSRRFLLNPEFDKPGSTEFLNVAESIIEGLKPTGEHPPEYLDFDHIHAHYLAGRDIFVTEDKKILKLGSQLKDLGIRIMNFEELLRTIEENGIQWRVENPEESKPQRIKIQIAERDEAIT